MGGTRLAGIMPPCSPDGIISGQVGGSRTLARFGAPMQQYDPQGCSIGLRKNRCGPLKSVGVWVSLRALRFSGQIEIERNEEKGRGFVFRA